MNALLLKTNYNKLNILYTIISIFKLVIIVVEESRKTTYNVVNNVDLIEKKD